MRIEAPFTVIIPCFNAGGTISETLESLVYQTATNFDVVAINDGSTDNTLEIIKSFKECLNLTIIDQKNLGLGHARNIGIDNAKGEYLAFLDSDDYWLPKKMEVLYQIIQNEYDVICHNEFVLKNKKILGINKYGPHKSYESLLFKGNCLSPSAVIARRKLVQRVGSFMTDPQCHGVEDYDLWLKLARINAKFYYTDEVLGVCRIHASNMSSDDNYRDREDYVLQKHFLSLNHLNDKYSAQINSRKSIQFAARGWDAMKNYAFKKAFTCFLEAFKLDPYNKKIYKYLFLGFPKLITLHFEKGIM